MKVYLELPVQSRGLQRVQDALEKYAPEKVQIVHRPSEAELTVIHVYGRHETTKNLIAFLNKNNQPYVMIQYALRSTMRPNTKDWIEMWQGAKLVWSYYDLLSLCSEDGVEGSFPYYHSPLGAEFIFKDGGFIRDYTILASSQHALSESARECAIATNKVDGKMFHLGHDLRRPNVISGTNITDEDLAFIYSRCHFVSGLRRIEGFELPAAEGILCGARPIMFDKPHYRQWFDDLAEFIPEGTRDEVIDSLEKLFRQGARPVTEAEKAIARERFNWETIIGEFWRKVL